MKLYVFPGNIEDDILQIASQQIPYMRTEKFSILIKESEKMLLDLIDCPKGRVIFYTASGTGAMDAVVSNYVTLKNKAFIVAGGSFGYRWKNLCDYYGCNNELYEVPFAKDIDYVDLEEKISYSKPDVFLCQHHETSTGQLFDLHKISKICSKYNVSLVVDAISSFLSDPLSMRELNIDICITSSQKGLNISPGLSLIFLSTTICDTQFNDRMGYYFDFKENLKNLLRGQTPYSPATTIFLQLHERLKRNTELGVDRIIEDVRTKAIFFRKLCNENQWKIPAENQSNCITGFYVNTNSDVLFKKLMDDNVYIMPGSIPNFFRVSHLGLQSEADLKDLSDRIKEIELA